MYKILILILLFTSCTTDSIQKTDYSKYESTHAIRETKDIEIQILELINEYRISIGLCKLKYEPIIKSVAYLHNIDMINANQLSHNGFVERSDYLIYKTHAQYVGENLAYGYSSTVSVYNAWLKSPTHKKNIEGNYTHFDISVELNKDGNAYITNIFIKK